MASVGFFGVRGSCPCADPALNRYGGSTSCVAIEPGGGRPPVVLDLGTGSRRLGELLDERFFPQGEIAAGAPAAAAGESPSAPAVEGAEPVLELSAFVTHLHFDHVQGLPFFLPALRPRVRLTIHGPADGSGLEEAFARFVRPPYFPVALADLPADIIFRELADGDVVDADGVAVTAREVPHVGRTLGYRLELGSATVAYLGDHQAPNLAGRVLTSVAAGALALAKDVDLLIHDAQYTDAEFGAKPHWGHSTLAYAVELARQSGARRLALFHHDPTHDDDTLDRLGEEAARLAPSSLEVIMTYEGLTIELEDAAGLRLAGSG